MEFMVWSYSFPSTGFEVSRLDVPLPRAELSLGRSIQSKIKQTLLNCGIENVKDETPPDSMFTPDGLLIVSSRMKVFLEKEGVSQIEYFQVGLGTYTEIGMGNMLWKPIGAGDYFLVHILHPIDALDLKASEPIWHVNQMTGIKSIIDLKRVVLKPEAFPQNRTLFRVKKFSKIILARKNLVDQIIQANFNGVVWRDLDSFRP